MKILRPVFLAIGLFFCGRILSAPMASATIASQFLHPKSWSFEENIGQLIDPDGKALSEIKFYGSFGGAQVYCSSQRLSFVFVKTTSAKSSSQIDPRIPIKLPVRSGGDITANRVDLQFEGSNPDVEILGGEKQAMTVNYASAKSGSNAKGFRGVSFYKTLTYKNIYRNIDMVVTAVGTGIEYKFIVHPGGNAADIKLVRNGADHMKMLEDGGIKYNTTLGAIKESKPQTFISNTLIKSNFVRKGNSSTFKTADYDHRQEMVIDPGISWATYYGSDSDDESYSVAADASGNVYIAGITNSLTGIATTGAYQTSLAGGVKYDVFVAKFSGSGSLIWATYYGGDSGDYTSTCALDKHGNLYVGGYTSSSNGIATNGTYRTSYTGSSGYLDAFLAKFDSSGGLLWGTYFGGSRDEYVYSVATDGSDNAYIYGWTSSTSGIATAGSYQTAYGGGTYDAFLAKFNSSGGLIWASYYGGSGTDYGLGVSAAPDKNVYVTGTTTSSSGIASSGAYKTTVDATYGNAYLAAFDSSGSRQWGTYYGGIGNGDIGFSADAHISGHVYITGNTANSSGIATSGTYQTKFGGSSDVFLADFSNKGKLNWGTYFGGMADETGYGVATDALDNIYITGSSTSDNNMVTPDAYQSSNISAYGNAFLARFDSTGRLSYGTYLGGSFYDVARGVACDNTGDVYVAGMSQSDYVATSGAYQSYNAGQNDAFLAKFLICNLVATFTGPDLTCGGSVTSYKAAYDANATYVWTIKGGTLKSGNYTDSITVEWNSTGPASVGLEEVNLSGCVDSTTQTITLGTLPPPPVLGDTIECPSSDAIYRVTPVSGATYSWSASGGTISGSNTNDSAIVSWPSAGGTGTVTVKIDYPTGCSASGSVSVKIGSLPAPHISGDTGICASALKTYTTTKVSGSTYAWSVSGGTITNGTGDDSINVSWQSGSGNGTVELKETNASGCVSSNSENIKIAPALSVPVISGDTGVCAGSISTYGVDTVHGGSYTWAVTGGIIKSGQSTNSIQVQWPSTASSGTVAISESNLSGCETGNQVQVLVHALPAPAISGNKLVCSGGLSSFSLSPVSGDLYGWSVTAGTIMGSDTGSNIGVLWQSTAGNGNVVVTETNIYGCSSTDTLAVSIYTLTAPVISGYTTVCPQTTATYYIKPVSGVTYNWSAASGNISSINGRDSIIVFWQANPGSGTVSIQESSSSGGCKAGSSANITIVPNPVPQIKVTDLGKAAYLFQTKDSIAASAGYIWLINGTKYVGYHVQHVFVHDSSYHISLTVVNANGCTNKFDTTIQVTDAGISENNQHISGISIYPNPFKDLTEIHYTIASESHIEITISDMLGKNISMLSNGTLVPGSYVTSIDGKALNLNAGIYLVKISINGSVETEKIVRVKD